MLPLPPLLLEKEKEKKGNWTEEPPALKLETQVQQGQARSSKAKCLAPVGAPADYIPSV